MKLSREWLRDANLDIFGNSKFRGLQEDICMASMEGVDLIGTMATGVGKSLCYQLPAALSSGVTVIVSPLKSLMEDQVKKVNDLDIPVFLYDSDLSPELRCAVLQSLSNSKCTLFYTSPEQLLGNDALRLVLKKLNCQNDLSRVVIDEAHCIVMWGDDFRPAYSRLGELRDYLRGVPFTALTTTAGIDMRGQIERSLHMPPNVHRFIGGCERPNLFFTVADIHQWSGRLETDSNTDVRHRMISTFIRELNNTDESGIVYCPTILECSALHERLSSDGVKAKVYHGKMSPTQRTSVMDDWDQGTIRVVVATIAFGMGIDKDDVRFVFHSKMSKSLEAYYQEAGRGGRDGERAICTIFYSKDDHNDELSSAFKAASTKGRMEEMNAYCLNDTTCRHVVLLRHFNQDYQATSCEMCDVCAPNTWLANQGE